MSKSVPFLATAVLIAFLIIKVFDAGPEKRFSSAKMNQRVFTTALKQYHKDHGAHPRTEEGLSALLKISAATKQPYLRAVPRDPWGNSYIYKSFGNGYTITSYGADGVAGGEAENKDIDTYVKVNQ